jgi:hypothetical protein
MVELLRRCLTPLFDVQRFKWLYQAGPYGQARAWLAYDGTKDNVIGAAAAFPRRVDLDSVEKQGWVLGDFCLDSRFRSLGPALQLQRACLQAAETPPYEFCYDFPSPSMTAIYKRLGVPQCGTLVRWARAIRTAPRIEKLLRSRTVSRSLGIVADSILTRRGWRGETDTADLMPQEQACGGEFTELDRRVRQRPGLLSVRTAAHLNWRFLSHPSIRHEILTARRKGVLVGYIVYTRDLDDTSVVDLCSLEEPALIARLLAGAVDRLREYGAVTVSMNAGSTHPWSGIFRRAGFLPREDAPVMVHVRPGATISLKNFAQDWYLMRGERDS